MAQPKYFVLLLLLQIASFEWAAKAERMNSTNTTKFYQKKVYVPLNATTFSKFHHRSLGVSNSSFELDLQMLSENFDDLSGLNIIDTVEDNALNELPSATSASPSKYLTSQVCGKKLYCRRGDRGPCERNEIFSRTAVTIKRPSCMNLMSYVWNGCFPASSSKVTSLVTSSSIATGGCTLRFPKIPCFGYPSTYRYFIRTKRCYHCASTNARSVQISSGPCEADKIFVDLDGINGICLCRSRNHLLLKGDEKCHRIYTKGPCKVGYWLEPETNGYGVCRLSPCPAEKCDGLHIFWRSTSRSKGGCYKSFSRGPCKLNSYFLIEDYPTKSGSCVSRYGSSFNSLSYYSSQRRSRRYPVYSNWPEMRSLWSNFGAYPPLNLHNFLDDGFDDYSWDF